MTSSGLAQDAAVALVERLFKRSIPRSSDRVLYPGCGDGVFIGAVRSYCDRDSFRDVPEEVAVDTTVPDGLRESYPSAEFVESDFLGDTLDLDGEFDYVISDPPTIRWDDLGTEKQRAYLYNSGVLTEDSASGELRSDYLFIEQAMNYLDSRGRGVFVTDQKYKTEEAAAPIRARLLEQVTDVDELRPEADGRSETSTLVTVIDGTSSSRDLAPVRYEPERVETNLGRSVETDRPFRLKAVMTADPKTYSINETPADTYLDLLHRDFDAALVRDYSTTGNEICGFVSRGALRLDDAKSLREAVEPFGEGDLLRVDDPLSEAIETLRVDRFSFVGQPNDVRGIVTRFDLNRLPVYLHLYDCFSGFEIGLRQLIRREEPEWESRTDVPVYSSKSRDLITDKLTTAQLSELIDIARDLELVSALKPVLNTPVELNHLRKLRNDIAHYNPIVHTMSDGDTMDDDERGARQFAMEYETLQRCINFLPTGDSSTPERG